jgi:hypothetical protein
VVLNRDIYSWVLEVDSVSGSLTEEDHSLPESRLEGVNRRNLKFINLNTH